MKLSAIQHRKDCGVELILLVSICEQHQHITLLILVLCYNAGDINIGSVLSHIDTTNNQFNTGGFCSEEAMMFHTHEK